MANFFNRNLEFSLTGLKPITNERVSLAQFTNHRMQARISKDVSSRVNNSGSITITNLNQETVTAFLTPSSPLNMLYSLKAGYGYERENLATLSTGAVLATDWQHLGGDTSFQLSLTEGHKRLHGRRFKENFKIEELPERGGAELFLQSLIDIDYEIVYLPNKEQVISDIRETEGSGGTSVAMKSDDEILTDILSKAKYSWFLENNKIYIYKSRGENLVVNLKGTQTRLNFKTGLISANLTASVDSRFSIYVSWLKFETLFIPTITPHSSIIMDEPAYRFLDGEYVVYNCSYNLSNKTGAFNITGKAISRFFIKKFPRLQEFFAET